jgi:hypothetical protein
MRCTVIYDPPMSWYEPEVRPEYASCARCHECITVWDPDRGENKSLCYAWFDETFERPCCSEWCRDVYEDNNYEFVVDDYEPEVIAKLILQSRAI